MQQKVLSYRNELKNKRKKGFTLIEMLIVLAIIAALVLIISPSFGSIKKSQGTSLNAQAKGVETAILQYEMANNNLTDYIKAAPAVTDPTWMGTAANVTSLKDLLVKEAGLDPAAPVTAKVTATFFATHTKSLDETKLSKYVKGSSDKMKNFVVIDSADADIQKLNGKILSLTFVKDNDGYFYNGSYIFK